MTLIAGVDTENAEVAEQLIRALCASGSIAIPNTTTDWANLVGPELAAKTRAWVIDILEDSGGRQPTFVDRLKYLDALKVRALLLPERSVLEGEFGTKAEATAHADMAITNIQLMDRHVTRHVNWHAVDQVLALNFGDAMRGKVRLVAAPLIDEQVAFLREAYRLVLTNPQGFGEEFGMIDTDALKDKLGVPKSQEIAQAGDDIPELGDGKDLLPGLTREELGRLDELAPAVAPEEAPEVAPEETPKAVPGETPGVAVDETLNGAQVTAAKDLLNDLVNGLIPGDAVFELMVAMGISKEGAQRLIDSTRNFKPKTPAEVVDPTATELP